MRLGMFAVASLLAGACVAPLSDDASPKVPVGGSSPLVGVFARAATATGVPAELLAAMSYTETRLTMVAGGAHGREAFGLMGLSREDLARGAKLAGVSVADAMTDPEASVRAGAMLIKAQDPDAHTLEDYLAVLGQDERDAVQEVLAAGADGRDERGASVVIAARPEHTGTARQELSGADYGPASFVAAYSGNFQTANRTAIDHIVIHDMEGSYAGSISWFKDPAAKVSAHYLIKSSTGEITQMVKEKDIAWHDACFNSTTVGIEHEGYEAKPEMWFTETMYVSSAKLAAYLCDKYNVPKEHGSILGHGEAPDCSDHTDPGPGWDWDHYIDLVKTGGAPMLTASDATVDSPIALESGEHATVTVTLTNTGNVAWDLDATRLGTADPQDRASELYLDGDWISSSRATGVDARVEPGAQGTFTFDVVAPSVKDATEFDEAFQLVQGDTQWFGPEVHVIFDVSPKSEDSGCSAGGGGSAGSACAMLALGALVSRRRRRRRS